MPFPHYHQLDGMDCGPTCLRIISKYYGRNYNLNYLRQNCFYTNEGVSLLGISEAAERIGFRTIGVEITYQQLTEESPFPCIIHWRENHFVVVYKIKKYRNKEIVYVSDPAHGLVTYTKEEFCDAWSRVTYTSEKKGYALLLDPLPAFYKMVEQKGNKMNLSYLFHYLTPYRRLILQLLIGLFTGSILQLFFPFLTQSLVDYGIGYQNINFVYLILIAQLVLFASQMIKKSVVDS